MYAPKRLTAAMHSMAEALEVWIFKTDLCLKRDIELVSPLLNTLPGIKRWTVDREDKDRILKVIAYRLSPQHCIRLLNEAGYYCEELTE